MIWKYCFGEMPALLFIELILFLLLQTELSGLPSHGTRLVSSPPDSICRFMHILLSKSRRRGVLCPCAAVPAAVSGQREARQL